MSGESNSHFLFQGEWFLDLSRQAKENERVHFLKTTIHFHQVVRHRRRNIAHAGWPITDMVASWARTHSWIGQLRRSLFKTAKRPGACWVSRV